MTKPLKARFFAKVTKGPNCWGWTATVNNKGYGMIYPGPELGGTNRNKWPAQRVSWIVHKGPIPEGLHVLHSCDNPLCTNPKHLFLGSHTDNMRDKHAKGRAFPEGWLERVRAHAMTRRKLTPEQVEEARRLREAGAGWKTIAVHFGVDRDAVKCWFR